MRLLLVGVGFFPHVVAGDKNFFIRMLPLLTEKCESVDVLSINDRSGSSTVEIKGCPVTYHNARRALHTGSPDRFFSGSGRLTDYCHKHRPPQEISELFITTLGLIPRLRHIIRDRKIDVIHFMDNMGPSMRLIKTVFPKTLVTHSAMAYAPKGPLYDKYLVHSMSRLDKLIPYSQAYAKQMQLLGINSRKIKVIRWGVDARNDELNNDRKQEIREAYGVTESDKLLVWSGFIQQIVEDDFRAAVDIAREVIRKRSECKFLFTFKPRSFKPEFKELESEGIRVETNIEHFFDLLETADYLYSPILRTDVIVAPPLTWLEAMSMGTPVITTGAGGVAEVVIDGDTGFVAPSFNELIDVTIRAVDSEGLADMGRRCREFIESNCDIRKVAEEYLGIWENKGSQ